MSKTSYRTALIEDFDRQKFNESQKDSILSRFDKLAAIRGEEFSFRIFYEAYGSRFDTEAKMEAIKKIIESPASVNCANALTPTGKAIYNALKSNKSTIRDNDKRKWRDLEALDVDIHDDSRLRVNLWQWQETFSDKGVIERKQVLRSALASEAKSNFELVVRY